MTLEQYRQALGVKQWEMAQQAEKISKQHITPALLREAEHGCPIAEAKALAICAYLSKEFGRAIAPDDIAGLKTC